MELEEMKTMWDKMNKEMNHQKILTDNLVLDLTKEKYKNKFTKVEFFETIGAVICFASAIWLILNFTKLEFWYLELFAIFAIIILVLLPIMTLKKIRGIKVIELESLSFKDTLVNFQRRKHELIISQKINVFVSIILAVVVLPLFTKIVKGIDLFGAEHINSFYIYLPILLTLLFFLSKWGIKSYQNLTKSAEHILKELDK